MASFDDPAIKIFEDFANTIAQLEYGTATGTDGYILRSQIEHAITKRFGEDSPFLHELSHINLYRVRAKKSNRPKYFRSAKAHLAGLVNKIIIELKLSDHTVPQRQISTAPRIFLSYRRNDASGYLVAIDPLLEARFGRENIFRDLDTIPYGADFVAVIENSVNQCDVLLAVIGPHWLNITDDEGIRRLDNKNDFVRLEVATALKRDILVIPVLVGGARMPKPEELPDDLQLLTRRNALTIADREFEQHVNRLIVTIDRALE